MLALPYRVRKGIKIGPHRVRSPAEARNRIKHPLLIFNNPRS